MRFYVAVAVCLVIAFGSCKHSTPLSDIPSIRLVSMTPDSVRAGSQDTVYITFSLADGDADLGNDPNGTVYDIYMKDSRVDTFQGYFFPTISSDVTDAGKGVEGTCVFKQLAAFLVPRDSLHMITGDTLFYEIYIKDKAQHESNHITTPKLYIRP
jgi:hypothetical protein